MGSNVPNLEGLFLRGRGGNAAPLRQIQKDEFKSHTHGNTVAWGSYQYGADTQYGDDDPFIILPGLSVGGVETRPVNMAVRYLMKALK